ncbi:GlcNAc-PI de-N-acetylase [Leptospira perolatii]|uniref:GlcNAc-PI de-N-acetylase n=1 Tax=Leptospira perolatii TaxID=2023191 RepID=A0A2M9ZLX0_9LEPT|nr:GlcNAc-PI de-N-acetylase [Leptospira perolatii]PJZ72933.1 GlcNAc-PI de-N-acetylase [Leptospira perolatii]
MRRSLVIAPHPDDELLGAGGTLLRRKEEGVEIGWLIVTGISEELGWNSERVQARSEEIKLVEKELGFDRVFNLRYPTTRLDQISMSELIGEFSKVFKEFEPNEIFLPHRGDVHSDHRVVFEVGSACAKWFRYPSIQRVLAYETLSETEFGLNHESRFLPNYFINIESYLEKKIELLSVYKSEMGQFPFPRSIENVRALATFRGGSAGFAAAEAFELLMERS